MDFIAGFYPTSAVSARVFMSAPMIPKFVATLTTILDQHAKRFGGGGMPPPPAVDRGVSVPSGPRSRARRGLPQSGTGPD